MILIYCNWISTRWQCSVDFYKNRKATTQKEKQFTKQYKNTESQNTQNRKQKDSHKMNVMKHKSSS